MSNKCLIFKNVKKDIETFVCVWYICTTKGVKRMQRVMIEYKGVILFFLSIVVVCSVWNNRIKELNAQEKNDSTIVYYEK